jgi:glutamyl-tRNA reductase
MQPGTLRRRLDLLGTCSLVVSATAGLYHTLDLDSIAPRLTDPTLFIDLAMPVDIDPGWLIFQVLRSSDCAIWTATRPRRDAAVAKAEMFIDSRLAEFFEWMCFRGEFL